MKKYYLPSLSLLYTFEVVARRLSFTVAADELCLSQSAVSRKIGSLENELKKSLFVRKHRAIELTPEGRRLFDSVTRGLSEIAGCIAELRTDPETPQITLAAAVAFSYYSLLPRLERFSERYPEIDLRVLATDQRVDLRKENVDVAVLYGDGFWPGVEVQPLFDECVYPVCSPDYLRDHPELASPPDILNQILLHLEGGGNIWGAVDWQSWLLQQGETGQPARRGVRLNSYPMVLQGAEAGRGVALGWSYITDQMLAEDRLVCPVDEPLTTGYSYYIGASEKTITDPSIAGFFQWIMAEVKNEQ